MRNYARSIATFALAAGLAGCGGSQEQPSKPDSLEDPSLEVTVKGLEDDVHRLVAAVEIRKAHDGVKYVADAVNRGFVETTFDKLWKQFLDTNPFGYTPRTRLQFEFNIGGGKLRSQQELFGFLDQETAYLEERVDSLSTLFERGDYATLVRDAYGPVETYSNLMAVRSGIYSSPGVPLLPLVTDGNPGVNVWRFTEWEQRARKILPPYATFAVLAEHYRPSAPQRGSVDEDPLTAYATRTIITFGRNKNDVNPNEPWNLKVIMDDGELTRLQRREQTDVQGPHADIHYFPYGQVLVSTFKFGEPLTITDIGADGSITGRDASFNSVAIDTQERYRRGMEAVVQLLQARYHHQPHLFSP